MSPQRHITPIFLCSATEQIAQWVLAINVSCQEFALPFHNVIGNSYAVSTSEIHVWGQWRRGRWANEGRGTIILPLNVGLSKNFGKVLFLSENFRPKIWCKTHTWGGEFRGKIGILSTHNLLCRKFAAVCRKIATSCPAYFFNPRRRCSRCSTEQGRWF